jgi:hypothetical protein
MTQDFDAAEERARLAAFDLTAAANEVIRRRSITWSSARNEADYAELSRWTRYLTPRTVEDAQHDLGVASRAETEVATIVASRRSAVESAVGLDSAAEAKLIGRLTELARDCEKRAIRQRR